VTEMHASKRFLYIHPIKTVRLLYGDQEFLLLQRSLAVASLIPSCKPGPVHANPLMIGTLPTIMSKESKVALLQ